MKKFMNNLQTLITAVEAKQHGGPNDADAGIAELEQKLWQEIMKWQPDPTIYNNPSPSSDYGDLSRPAIGKVRALHKTLFYVLATPSTETISTTALAELKNALSALASSIAPDHPFVTKSPMKEEDTDHLETSETSTQAPLAAGGSAVAEHGGVQNGESGDDVE